MSLGPLDDDRIKDVKIFIYSILAKDRIYGIDADDLVADVILELVSALSQGTIRNTTGAGIAAWVWTCTSRKIFRYREHEKEKRSVDDLDADDEQMIADGIKIIDAREVLRRLTEEEIVWLIEVEAGQTTEQKRRARYVRECLLLKLSGKKRPSKHHWRVRKPRPKKKKTRRA